VSYVDKSKPKAKAGQIDAIGLFTPKGTLCPKPLHQMLTMMIESMVLESAMMAG
jgi:hypothetical protein